MNGFPEEDSEMRANHAERRTEEMHVVQPKYKQLNACYMSAVGSHDTCK